MLSLSWRSDFDLEEVGATATRRPMMEEEECLIFSGAWYIGSSSVFLASSFSAAVLSSFSPFLMESVGKPLVASGLKSEVGEVRLLASPVELRVVSQHTGVYYAKCNPKTVNWSHRRVSWWC